MTDPFEQMEGKDGFHVVKLDVGGQLSLHCMAYGQGEIFQTNSSMDGASVEVKAWPKKDKTAAGAWLRLHLVLDAVARYLTTGGTWEELLQSCQTMQQVIIGGLYFENYHLADSYLTSAGTYQHVFVHDQDKGVDTSAVLWEEPTYNRSGGVIGGFIDRSTLGELRDRDREQGSEEDEGAGGETEEADSPAPLPLSDRGYTADS